MRRQKLEEHLIKKMRRSVWFHWFMHDEVVGVGMKTDRIRTDITDIVFVFIFMSGFGFEYG
jgi:hypothetical protein